MPIRQATYRDISVLGSVLAAAFHEENLNVVFFPHRNEYPDDYVRAWRHHVREQWWDYTRTFALTYEIDEGQEIVTGAAEWARLGDGWQSTWGIRGWWDPRLLISPFLKFCHRIHRLIFANRASTSYSTPSRRVPVTYWNWQPLIGPFVAKFFVPPGLAPPASSSAATKTASSEALSESSTLLPAPGPIADIPVTISTPSSAPTVSTSTSPPYYELSCLGVVPNVHNKGYGRALCAWGLDKARQENLAAIVIAAENKERFYGRCGFTRLVGWATAGKGNPLNELGIRGGAVLWTTGGGDDPSEANKEVM